MSFYIDSSHSGMELMAPYQVQAEEVQTENTGRQEMLMIEVFPSVPPWNPEKSPKMGTLGGRSCFLSLSRL